MDSLTAMLERVDLGANDELRDRQREIRAKYRDELDRFRYSLYDLAQCMLNGVHTRKDPEGAFRLLQLGVAFGFRESVLLTAECLRDGVGTEADPVKANELFRRCHERSFFE